ncbi:aspartic proteinase CDR1-like [Argentina anserina]|uniref:aspartic proteinase CDR1-like n=1 Tax=Argentina anserina TaxID=57926 RepID=UPI0021764A00|nr:aspartic proteinase CDR1-like [Potentilla anserina]
MTLTNHNTIFCYSSKYHCSMVVIVMYFINLLFLSPTAAEYMNNFDGGFSAHLIRKNSPKSPLHNNKKNKGVRRLMGPDTPQSALIPDRKSHEHLMKFSVGTPPFEIFVIADTGSSLLWTQCKPCKNCYKSKHGIFDPRKSSTYRKVTCSDSECRAFDDVNDCKNNPQATCTYSQTYLDNEYSMGEVAKEVVTLKSTSGKVVVLKDIMIGCGANNKEADVPKDGIYSDMGVIGLGQGPESFISQISSHVGGRIFSQCLMPMDTSPEIESYINFGSKSKLSGVGVVSTPLVDKEEANENYFVTMKGITIGNDFIPFNSKGPSVEKGNTLIDCGTSFTYLPRDLYDRVVNLLVDGLVPKVETFKVPTGGVTNSSVVCLNTTTMPKAPKMALDFDGGGKLQLTSGYIYTEEDEENKQDVFCLGFMDSSDMGFPSEAVLGNNVQGNILVGFDLDRKIVSFKNTNCMKMGTPPDKDATEL